MKKIHIVWLLTLIFLTSACYTSSMYMTSKSLMNVQQGMTLNEVHAIFGSEPDYRRFDEGVEEWGYRRYNTSSGGAGWTLVWIEFVDGRVSRMDSNMEPKITAVSTPSPTAVTTVDVYPSRRQPVVEMTVMPEEDFDQFLNKVKFTTLSTDQKKLIEKALIKSDFTSTQALKLIKQVFSAQDKVEMMKKMYPYITDKRNFDKVIDTLTFSGYKDEIRIFIDEYHKTKK